MVEFIEIAVHNIVYSRKIYPETIFIRRHKYGVVIRKIVHPELNDYINKTLKAAYILIKANILDKIAIIFYKPCTDNDNEESFLFDNINIENIFVR